MDTPWAKARPSRVKGFHCAPMNSLALALDPIHPLISLLRYPWPEGPSSFHKTKVASRCYIWPLEGVRGRPAGVDLGTKLAPFGAI